MTHNHLALNLGPRGSTSSSTGGSVSSVLQLPAQPLFPSSSQNPQPRQHPPTPGIPQSNNTPASGTAPAASDNSQQQNQNNPIALPPPPVPSGDRITQNGPPVHPPAPEAPPPERESHWLAEIARLRSLLDSNPAATNHPPTPTRSVLYDSPEDVDRVRAAISASKDTEKKVVLPEIIPGFKAASIDFGSFLRSFR